MDVSVVTSFISSFASDAKQAALNERPSERLQQIKRVALKVLAVIALIFAIGLVASTLMLTATLVLNLLAGALAALAAHDLFILSTQNEGSDAKPFMCSIWSNLRNCESPD